MTQLDVLTYGLLILILVFFFWMVTVANQLLVEPVGATISTKTPISHSSSVDHDESTVSHVRRKDNLDSIPNKSTSYVSDYLEKRRPSAFTSPSSREDSREGSDKRHSTLMNRSSPNASFHSPFRSFDSFNSPFHSSSSSPFASSQKNQNVGKSEVNKEEPRKRERKQVEEVYLTVQGESKPVFSSPQPTERGQSLKRKTENSSNSSKGKKAKEISPNNRKRTRPLLDVLDAYPSQTLKKPKSRVTKTTNENKEDDQNDSFTSKTGRNNQKEDEINSNNRRQNKLKERVERTDEEMEEEEKEERIEDEMEEKEEEEKEEEERENVSFNTSNISTASLFANETPESIKTKGGRIVLSPARFRANKKI